MQMLICENYSLNGKANWRHQTDPLSELMPKRLTNMSLIYIKERIHIAKYICKYTQLLYYIFTLVLCQQPTLVGPLY